MAYSTDLMKDRVTILAREQSTTGSFGRTEGAWCTQRTIHAGVTWNKGARSLNVGAVEAYDTIMVRTRWQHDLNRECRLRWKGRDFQIQTFFDDFAANEMQMTAKEVQSKPKA